MEFDPYRAPIQYEEPNVPSETSPAVPVDDSDDAIFYWIVVINVGILLLAFFLFAGLPFIGYLLG